MKNKAKGRFGEEFAVKYLKSKGYTIICTNWTCRWGELDIIALDNSDVKQLVFIEVKYRKSESFGAGYESVTYYKKKSLYRSINMYLLQEMHSRELAENWRFDVISLQQFPGRIKVLHFQNLRLM